MNGNVQDSYLKHWSFETTPILQQTCHIQVTDTVIHISNIDSLQSLVTLNTGDESGEESKSNVQPQLLKWNRDVIVESINQGSIAGAQNDQYWRPLTHGATACWSCPFLFNWQLHYLLDLWIEWVCESKCFKIWFKKPNDLR